MVAKLDVVLLWRRFLLKQQLLFHCLTHDPSVGRGAEVISNKIANGFFKLYPHLECFSEKYEAIKRSYHSSVSAQHLSKESPIRRQESPWCFSGLLEFALKLLSLGHLRWCGFLLPFFPLHSVCIKVSQPLH